MSVTQDDGSELLMPLAQCEGILQVEATPPLLFTTSLFTPPEKPPPETQQPEVLSQGQRCLAPQAAGTKQAAVVSRSSREGCSILSSISVPDPRGLPGLLISRTLLVSKHHCRDVRVGPWVLRGQHSLGVMGRAPQTYGQCRGKELSRGDIKALSA